jgi:NAD(P)-dependent dehydrogenase (short-subunit alcohol dehydrogenase family)
LCVRVVLDGASSPAEPVDQVDVIDDWNRTIDVNIKGVLYGMVAALPYMKEQKARQIINVSSVAGHKVGPGSAVYAATKFAVRALSEGLRQEVKPYNIRTTVISPGTVATELPELNGTSPRTSNSFTRHTRSLPIRLRGRSPTPYVQVVDGFTPAPADDAPPPATPPESHPPALPPHQPAQSPSPQPS